MTIDYEKASVYTPDGFVLALYRSRPGAHARDVPPALLLPGANANRFAFGVDRASSLPVVLNERGFDVWILEFRGSRSSRWIGHGRPTVDLARKLEQDLPAAVRRVSAATGHRRVNLVGHSLGGLLAHLHAGGPHGDGVARIVTMAVPGSLDSFFGRASPLLKPPARALAPWAARLSGLGIDRLVRWGGPFAEIASMPRQVGFGSVNRAQRRAWLTHGVEDLPGGDLAQLMRWLADGHLQLVAGMDDAERLARVRAPVRLVASRGDRVVTPRQVARAYALLGAPERELIVVSRDRGATRDYAHTELLLSPLAARDVHPLVAEWLERSGGGLRLGTAPAGRPPADSSR